jgi:hypothetical protein
MNKIKYYHFSNDTKNKTGIVTFAIKLVESLDDQPVFRLGYSLTNPNTKLNKVKAKKEARKGMESANCTIMVRKDVNEDMEYIARVAFCTAITSGYALPEWARKLDLAMKAHRI